MKTREIRELSLQELEGKLSERMEESANLKFQLALRQLDNTAQVRSVRRDLARLRTIYREHQLNIRPLKQEEQKRGSQAATSAMEDDD